MQLKEHDKIILNELRKNSRSNLKKINENTNISIPTIKTKTKKLENKFIEKYVSLLKFEKLGYCFKVHYLLKCENYLELINEKNINNVSLIKNNNSNIYIECLFNSLKEKKYFEDVIIKKKAKIINEHFILDELKKEEFNIK
jgi:DNA-binding Lrp family transcriptional regulator